MKSFKTIAEQHPESVALVFQKHFINAQPTERNLVNAIKVKGELFCYDLADLIENEQSSFLGLFESKEKRAANKAARQAKRAAAAKAQAENPTAAKKGFTLDKALAIFGSIAGAAGSLLTKKTTAETEKDPNQSDRILGIDRSLFIVMAVLGAILAFLIIKKYSK